MGNLDIARSAIDEIDRQMARLFERRMEAVEMISDEKKALGLPVIDEKRRAAVIEKNTDLIENEDFKDSYREFIKSVVSLSESYQLKLSGLDMPLSGIPLNSSDTVKAPSVAKTEKPLDNKTLDNKTVKKTSSKSIPDNIIIERGALDRLDKIINLDRKVLIVSDDGVPEEYGETLFSLCSEPYIIKYPSREDSKSPENHMEILDFLQDEGFSRTDAIVALGGGVVSDLAGYAASTYMHGIDYYIVPTTLISCIDASVGGENAVNSRGIKDIFGTVYMPSMTVIDPELLVTLPARQYSNGFAEAIKIGLTLDAELFDIFERGDPYSEIDEIIKRCVTLKSSIIADDEYDKGVIRVLDFGHTIGHGIESIMGYSGGLLHGECVALGMLAVVSPKIRTRLTGVYARFDLPTSVICEPEIIYSAVLSDKKSDDDEIQMVFCDEIGTYTFESISADAAKDLIYEEFGE